MKLLQPRTCNCGRTYNAIPWDEFVGIQWFDEEVGIGLYLWNCSCSNTTIGSPVNEVSLLWFQAREALRLKKSEVA